MKVRMWAVALLIFVVLFGGIAVTMFTGDWATTTDKIPNKFETGEYAGEYNPEDIRGSYTFNDVAVAFGIELGVLYDAFGIPADTDGSVIKTKDIEATYGEAEIGNESVRVFVALYKGLPISLIDTYLTPRAVEIILEENPNLTQEQKDYLAEHQVEMSGAEPADITETLPATETSHTEDTQLEIKGTTTFQQALDAGLTSEQIEEIIGGAMPAGNVAIRDYCSQNGLSFSEIKTKLSDALSQAE